MALQSYNTSLVPEERKLGIENWNFLSPVGFKFTIGKLKGVDFFCQSAAVPAIRMESVQQGTRFNKIPQPGDELYYEDLVLTFLVDENMKNWQQVHDWMREITTPYSEKEFKYNRGTIASQYNDRTGAEWQNQWKSDASLFVLSSNYQPIAEFMFRDAFPTNLTTIQFDSSVEDIQYFTAEVTLKYTYYDYAIYPAAQATDESMRPTRHISEDGVELS